MKVSDVRLMLAELDEEDEVGFSDGEGGYCVGRTAYLVEDPHTPGCGCGCAALILEATDDH